MRKKLLMLTTGLVVLAGGLIEVFPKSAAAVTCPLYCAQGRAQCRVACNNDIDCLHGCQDDYANCCHL
jgi:hypothetical protein